MRFTHGVPSWLLALAATIPWPVSAQWRGERPAHERAPVVVPGGAPTPSPIAISPRAFASIDGVVLRGSGTLRADSVVADTPSRRGRHAKIGALVGGGVGLGVAVFGIQLVETLTFGHLDENWVLPVIVFTASGAAIGAGIGALFP